LSIKSIIYKEKGDYDTAMEAIDQAIILLPRKGDYYFIKSDILKAKGHEAGAILELKKGLEFETKNKEMLIKLGSLYVEKSMFKEALPIFLETLSKKINEFETYTNLGKIYLGMEDFESAHLCLERAVEINPDSQAPYYPLGQLNLKQNQIIEAIDYFKKGMELSGGGIEYLRALRDSFQELDKKQEAYYYAMAIVKTKDFNSSDYDKLGDISSTLKDYAKAVFYYKEASWLEPKNSEYLFKYGLSCVLAENYFEAKKALDTLVMNYKNSPSRTKAIELLTKINDKIKEVNGGVQKENKPDMQE
jgi:tetratricopeptide (TPR) repeat protein